MGRQLSERLYKRGNTWWCWGYDATGKRWRQSTHQQNKKAAQRVADKITIRYAISADRAEDKTTIEEALLDLIDADKRKENSPKTIQYHQSKARHLKRILGEDTKISEITLADTTAYMDKRLKEEAHRHTIQKEIRTLTESLNAAKRLGRYHGNPAELKPPELKGAYKPRETWLNAEQAQKLIAYPPNPRERTNRRPHIAAYIHLGVRKSELFRIIPEHVDLEANTVWIDGTKNDEAPRTIQMSSTARAVIKGQLDGSEEGKPIFARWEEGSADRDLKRICDRIDESIRGRKRKEGERREFPICSFNDLRRTFASLLANAGVPMQHTAALMGHKSLDMVMRVYGRLSSESLQEAVDRLPRHLLPKTVTGDVTTSVTKSTPLSQNLAVHVGGRKS